MSYVYRSGIRKWRSRQRSITSPYTPWRSRKSSPPPGDLLDHPNQTIVPTNSPAHRFKFTRVYPLTQYDLPTSVPLLTFPQPSSPPPSQTSTSAQSSPSKQNLIPPTPSRPMLTSPPPKPLEMSAEEIEKNPLLDFTEPQFITLVVSDVGILTPSVSHTPADGAFSRGGLPLSPDYGC